MSLFISGNCEEVHCLCSPCTGGAWGGVSGACGSLCSQAISVFLYTSLSLGISTDGGALKSMLGSL